MTNRNDEPKQRTKHADRDRDLDARLTAYLREAPTRAPEHLLEAAALRVHVTPQRRRGWRTG